MGSKTPAPVRDFSETINKIYSGNFQSRRAGRISGLGLPNVDTYVADALILRKPKNLTEIGDNKKLEDLQKIKSTNCKWSSWIKADLFSGVWKMVEAYSRALEE